MTPLPYLYSALIIRQGLNDKKLKEDNEKPHERAVIVTTVPDGQDIQYETVRKLSAFQCMLHVQKKRSGLSQIMAHSHIHSSWTWAIKIRLPFST